MNMFKFSINKNIKVNKLPLIAYQIGKDEKMLIYSVSKGVGKLSFSFTVIGIINCFNCYGKHLIVGIKKPCQGLEQAENSEPHGILISESSLRGLQLNTKTWLYPTASKLQGWMPHAKQLARQEHKLTHQQIDCLKSY